MIGDAERAQMATSGWLRVRQAVPPDLCAQLIDVLKRERDVPVDDPTRWETYGGPMGDFVPIWGHQAQWDIRQHPDLHRIWSALWDTDALLVSLDSCRFTPPWRDGFAEPHGIHWDHDPRDETARAFQGVIALTDTAPDQGGFRCIPALFGDHSAWPDGPTIDDDGDLSWFAPTEGHEIVHVPARTGDLIVWDSRLPHGNSKNLAASPRLAFYVQMFPASDQGQARPAIHSWRTGRCVPWWRDRPGYQQRETWPPATLSDLGRRLLGLDPWPAAPGG